MGFGGHSSGWLQFRKTLRREFNAQLDLDEIMARKPAWVSLDPTTDELNPLAPYGFASPFTK